MAVPPNRSKCRWYATWRSPARGSTQQEHAVRPETGPHFVVLVQDLEISRNLDCDEVHSAHVGSDPLNLRNIVIADDDQFAIIAAEILWLGLVTGRQWMATRLFVNNGMPLCSTISPV